MSFPRRSWGSHVDFDAIEHDTKLYKFIAKSEFTDVISSNEYPVEVEIHGFVDEQGRMYITNMISEKRRAMADITP